MISLSGFEILLVEDDSSLLQVLALALRSKGAIVTEALNGQIALDVLEGKVFDLVLSDVQMPVVDGIELLTKIRLKDPKIPVFLFITGQSRLTEAESLSMGASGLMIKPFRISALIERIDQVLRPAIA